MAEREITRKQIIVVGKVGKNTYGDLVFDDKDGSSYKVSVKRIAYFEKVVLPGATIQLNYAMSSFGKEYIYSAVLIKDGIPDAPQPQISPIADALVIKPLTEHKSSPETGMWWGQVGEMLRCGDIDKSTPQGKTIRSAYYAEMLRVLGITFKEKNVLVQEAKRLGAKE